MTDQQMPTTTPDSEADVIERKDQESKPIANEPANPPNNKQTKIRPRYLPSPPGFFPIPMDIVITMTMQFLITFTNILVIISSAAIDIDNIGWYILFQVIFTLIGFWFFTHQIKRNILVYYKFYHKLDSWKHRRTESLKNSDSSCSNFLWLLTWIIYWILIILIFPVVIIWSMYQSYRWYQDRRKKVHTAESQADLEANYKQKNRINKRVYNIWGLGVLCKNASMISIFIQELPFLIMCGMIGNNFGLAIFPIAICIKFIFWIKHCYDLRTITIFYKAEDFLLHFGLLSIQVDIETKEIFTEYISDRGFELATLQKGDWCLIYTGEEVDNVYETEWTEDNSKIVWIYKTKDFKRVGKPNLVCIDFESVPIKAFEDWSSGKTKKINVPEDCFHEYDRYDVPLILMPDKWWDIYHDEEDVAGTEVQEYGKNGTEEAEEIVDDTNIKSMIPNENNEDNVVSEVNDAEKQVDVTEVPEAGNENIETVKIDVNDDENVQSAPITNGNHEENTYTSIDNKDKEVDDNEIEPESKVDVEEDENEEIETQALTESPVVINKDDIDVDSKIGSENYQSIPLEDNDAEIDDNQNES